MAKAIFKTNQTYVRESHHNGRLVREFGEVSSVTPSRVTMTVVDSARRHTGTETFSPANGAGWRLCAF